MSIFIGWYAYVPCISSEISPNAEFRSMSKPKCEAFLVFVWTLTTGLPRLIIYVNMAAKQGEVSKFSPINVVGYPDTSPLRHTRLGIQQGEQSLRFSSSVPHVQLHTTRHLESRRHVHKHRRECAYGRLSGWYSLFTGWCCCTWATLGFTKARHDARERYHSVSLQVSV